MSMDAYGCFGCLWMLMGVFGCLRMFMIPKTSCDYSHWGLQTNLQLGGTTLGGHPTLRYCHVENQSNMGQTTSADVKTDLRLMVPNE